MHTKRREEESNKEIISFMQDNNLKSGTVYNWFTKCRRDLDWVWHQKSCWHKNTNPGDAEEEAQQFAEDAEAKFGVGIFKEEVLRFFRVIHRQTIR